MSLAGLKKQFNKANQFVSERIGGAEGTQLGNEFTDMEKKMDVRNRLVDELLVGTEEYLHPNPAIRAKIAAMSTVSRWRGTGRKEIYPQPEGTLGESMIRNGREFADESLYGQSLVELGESFKQMGDIKYNLETNVRQNFIEPLLTLQSNDLKEIGHHRKKLWGRRLDYDCKKRKVKGGSGSDVEVKAAQDKFNESKELASVAMFNLFENDVEHIANLKALLDATLDYHRQAVDILEHADKILQAKTDEAGSRPRTEYKPPERVTNGVTVPDKLDVNNGEAETHNTHIPPSTTATASRPSCRALYDFTAQSEGELNFREGDILYLTSQLDDNWYRGSLGNNSGIFPISYVEVVNPLP